MDRFTGLIETLVETGAIDKSVADGLLDAHNHVLAQNRKWDRDSAADAIRVFAGMYRRDTFDVEADLADTQ